MNSVAKISSEFTMFNFGENAIRVINKSGEPWFVAKDVCDALSLTNSRKALTALDKDEKGVTLTYTLGGNQEVATVSESGMYTLVLRCRDAIKPGSVPHKFRKWVTAEVLPSIRKNGGYSKAKKVLPGKITLEQQEAIKQLVMTRGKVLPKDKQAKAMITMWSALKAHFGVTYKGISSDQFTEALSLVARVEIEGEFIGKQETLPAPALPISYPMSYFDQFKWMMGQKVFSAPWNYPANMLVPNGDYPNPLAHLLHDLKTAGYDVEAAQFQLLALQHHLEMLRHKIDRVERAIR